MSYESLGKSDVGVDFASKLAGKRLLITGGTGSFGSTMTKFLLDKTDAVEVRVFSRDETKQDEMRRKLSNERLNFFLGDVRDQESLRNSLEGVDFVFHAAALKQVPSCEFFPDQAIKTNVNGSENVIYESARQGVSSVVCLSTDKAVNPINVMGMTKALMEKTVFALARNNTNSKTNLSCVRYGNVAFSRGSVVPLFIEQIKNGRELTLTNPDMTRFLMTLDESVELVCRAFTQASQGDLFVKDVPSATVLDIAHAVSELLKKKLSYRVIGQRHGEKVHETLLTSAELQRAESHSGYFRVPLDSRDLNYEAFYETGSLKEGLDTTDLSSDTTRQLSVSEIIDFLKKIPEVRKLVDPN
jgi:UDP-N-acetylglucosamine 4,6-dehydratase